MRGPAGDPYPAHHENKGVAIVNPRTEKTDWATFTWNPVKGCRGPDGEGPCGYCYARDIAMGIYPDGFEPRFFPERLIQPMRMRSPQRIFTVSMGDLWGPWVPEEWIREVVQVVRTCKQHQFITLTKSPMGMRAFFEGERAIPENLWLGVSVDYPGTERRISELPAAWWGGGRCVSMEPLLGLIPEDTLRPLFKNSGIQWVIIGPLSVRKENPRRTIIVQPKKEWVHAAVAAAQAAGAFVYMKATLTETGGHPRTRDFPPTLRLPHEIKATPPGWW